MPSSGAVKPALWIGAGVPTRKAAPKARVHWCAARKFLKPGALRVLPGAVRVGPGSPC